MRGTAPFLPVAQPNCRQRMVVTNGKMEISHFKVQNFFSFRTLRQELRHKPTTASDTTLPWSSRRRCHWAIAPFSPFLSSTRDDRNGEPSRHFNPRSGRSDYQTITAATQISTQRWSHRRSVPKDFPGRVGKLNLVVKYHP